MTSVAELVASPALLSHMSNEALYTMARKDVEVLQQELLQRRFRELLPKIRAVRQLAEDIGVKGPNSAEDIVSMCLPHTFYKSYSLKDVEDRRYDRLTRWLQTLTAVDLSPVDASKCHSLESWLQEVENKTIVRPQCSSGTNGKISFFPRTRTEEGFFIRNFATVMSGFAQELDGGLTNGEADLLTPWPFATGRHNLPMIWRLLREHIYKEKPGEHVHVLGATHWNIDVMYLTARLRAAEAKGDVPVAQDVQRQLLHVQQDSLPSRAQTARYVDKFLEELVVNQRGRKVFLFAPPRELYALTVECEKRGLKPELAPNTFLFAPGRPDAKGYTLPDGWREQCKAAFPFEFQGAYAMTECTATMRLCSGGRYHPAPWVYCEVIDPSSSKPLPRKGLQTGRLALFDLLPENYWSGTITGDRVNLNWDGGCVCGRVGPYIHDDVTRLSNLKDDDKITCAKTADAYEKAVEYVLGQVNN